MLRTLNVLLLCAAGLYGGDVAFPQNSSGPGYSAVFSAKESSCIGVFCLSQNSLWVQIEATRPNVVGFVVAGTAAMADGTMQDFSAVVLIPTTGSRAVYKLLVKTGALAPKSVYQAVVTPLMLGEPHTTSFF